MIGNRDPRTPTQVQLDPARRINNRPDRGDGRGTSYALPIFVVALMFATLFWASTEKPN